MLTEAMKVAMVHDRRSQEVKKIRKKVYETHEKHKLLQIQFEQEMTEKKIRALKAFQEQLELDRISLKRETQQKEFYANAQALLNVI